MSKLVDVTQWRHFADNSFEVDCAISYPDGQSETATLSQTPDQYQDALAFLQRMMQPAQTAQGLAGQPNPQVSDADVADIIGFVYRHEQLPRHPAPHTPTTGTAPGIAAP